MSSPHTRGDDPALLQKIPVLIPPGMLTKLSGTVLVAVLTPFLGPEVAQAIGGASGQFSVSADTATELTDGQMWTAVAASLGVLWGVVRTFLPSYNKAKR